MDEKETINKLNQQLESLQYKYDKYRETALARVKQLEQEVEFWKGQYKDATNDAEETERQLEELRDKQ